MRTGVIFLAACVVGLAGCQTAAPGGPVVATSAEPGWQGGPEVGLKAPLIRFTGADGKANVLRPDTEWITIVGFVSSKGKECCQLSPVLTEAASRYWSKPVRVVQVSLPTGQCPHGAGCVETCHVRPLHLMALCDSGRIAYNAFGHPKDGTVLLIGGDGKVAGVTTVAGIDKIYTEADRLAAEAQQRSLPDYMQTYVD